MRLQASQAFQRLGPLANAATLVAELGADPNKVSARVGLDIRSLEANQRLPLRQVVDVLEAAAAITGCPHFGLLLGTRTDEMTQGIIYRLARNAPTLKQFCLDHITWQPGYTSGAIFYLHSFGDDYALGYGIVDRDSAGSAQVYDCIVAVCITILRLAMGDEAMPSEILMCRRVPEDIQPYHRILRVPIRFNEPQTCLVLPKASLRRPVPGADPLSRAVVLRELREAFERLDGDVVSQVRRTLRPLLLDGMPSMNDAARALGQSTRTLRRHLAQVGLTFEEIRDDVRFTMARELLFLTDLPVGDVAEALAFSTHASFTNAFQRWSGMAPSFWRMAHPVPAMPPAVANARNLVASLRTPEDADARICPLNANAANQLYLE